MAVDIALITNAAVSTPVGKAVQGGYYCFDAAGTFSGCTVTLSRLGPDGSTYISMGSAAALTAAGEVFIAIPSGIYKALVTGGPPTGMYARLSKVDLRGA